jgi:hypothetical protein
LLLVVTAGLAFGVAACGGDDRDAADGSGKVAVSDVSDEPGVSRDYDPCALITMDDAKEVLGESALGVRTGLDPPWKECNYATPFLAERGKLLSVSVRGSVDGEEFQREKDEVAQQQDADVRDVGGVGDEAFSDADALWVRHGEVELRVIAMVRPLTLPHVEEELQQALEVNKEVARRALERLE